MSSTTVRSALAIGANALEILSSTLCRLRRAPRSSMENQMTVFLASSAFWQRAFKQVALAGT
jgi:hypothetical protein